MAAESDEIVSVVGNGGAASGGQQGADSGQEAKDANANGETAAEQDSGSRGQEASRSVNGNKFRGTPSYYGDVLDHRSRVLGGGDDDDDGLGPLPYKWEKAYTEGGEAYFIDHNTGTSHWLDPRLSKFQKKSLEDCLDDELPYGWEKIDDPQYGTYFIDHVNRRTQYENPVLEAKRRLERSRPPKGPIFTRNPLELRGERITTTLLKSSRGLGFTIVGGDDNVDEFLQIKSIVPNGPAWLDGKLQTGDVLVYVNDICVLGFTHHDMVNVFQSILPGETVPLEVCRGYPLPFDPNDPNTEVVTTIAVDGINSDPEKARILMDLNMDGNYNFLDMSDPVSPPGAMGGAKSPLARLQADGFFADGKSEPEVHNISIVKGAMGFGFTIADSAYGQKVKKILDRQCCKNLQEGDILLAINSIGVKQMTHNEVVQVLKDCPKSQEAVLKVQRGQFLPSGAAGKNNSLTGERKMLKKSSDGLFRFGKDGGLFRSKTPTADLYSTQPKEILPTRPKTPLVDTRARAKTPSNELNTDEASGGVEKVTEKEGIPVDSKSNTSFADHDSINNDIPYIDPFPKMVMALTDRLSEANINPQHDKYHQDRLHSASKTFASSQSDLNNYDHIGADFYVNAPGFGVGPVPLMAPIPTYHQDTCYCFECQDFNRQQMEYMQQQQRNMYWQQNGRARKVNEYLMDRRRAGFSPLESHQGMWKLGQVSPGEGGFVQAPIQEEYALSEVTLERQTLGFGFRIVGGTEEGSQVTVGHIVPGGSADRDPRIATGDEILSIDGVNVVNASHHRVVQLMGEAALRGQVTMILRRKTVQKHKIYPYDIIVSRNENEGFGFVIISSTSQYYGSTIGKLIPGSPADRCAELKVGDRIVAVNRIDIAGMSHGDVVNLIKESGLHVRLTIGSPQVVNSQQMKAPVKNEGFFVDARFAGVPNHPQL
ncbi:membrane-associated guanylate kinase, WW and PDZ domain-containing protein 1 [Phlebotomus argentipes]|uniref:membrane-associated guanylate kinase, WW and PDZ domain-containing protein 1 n=1 Tax=Phlebotomus argentipes TaxID=94469 RepID=UPI0028931509|nr:membrane-associated guanylate kinase, WW and PDZ domain-containing protein 1 [Phlebotomus argentipes]XP_059622681.1 membrane-associated guanylate kinase, WW and PDZ domain-containing protein 1 [Phlebotomus argentipes]